jgi:hypothetical protein
MQGKKDSHEMKTETNFYFTALKNRQNTTKALYELYELKALWL